VIELANFAELEREIFGPVLHVIEFDAADIDKVVEQINARGYGLTMGLHTRLDDRIESITNSAQVGNIYVNRNQIGAVVGVQPFGGEGLSGTGFKAGGALYLKRFIKNLSTLVLPTLARTLSETTASESTKNISPSTFVKHARPKQSTWDQHPSQRAKVLDQVLNQLSTEWSTWLKPNLDSVLRRVQTDEYLPSPTGESNRLSLHGRGITLCLGGGNTPESALVMQVLLALAAGNAVAVTPSTFAEQLVGVLTQTYIDQSLIQVVELGDLGVSILAFPELAVVALEGELSTLLPIRQALAQRLGLRVQLVQLHEGWERFCTERVVTIDTTASGGNASLLMLAA
jgi:RHH-type proline utilization regulon transcriptional repressor/proline dehydrogenase/delta 1-pyrroline-5-carboxylate dehydrogenase